jgi:hypothetical protein
MVFLATLLYYQEKYGTKIDIVFHKIEINCDNKTFKSTLDTFLNGLYFWDDYIINIRTANNANNWMKKPIEYCAEIILQSTKEIVIFPLTFDGHKNVVVFRKLLFSFEWYEPHGNNFGSCGDTNLIILITTFLNGLKVVLEKRLGKSIFTSFANQPNPICIQNEDGPQSLHETYERVVRINEDGKCQLWSLLFIEQIIKSPNVTAKSFMNRFHQSYDGKSKYIFFHDVSIGFMYRLNQLLKNNFHITINEINENKEFFTKYRRDGWNTINSKEFNELKTQAKDTEKNAYIFLEKLKKLKENINHHLSINPLDSSSTNIHEMDSDITEEQEKQILKTISEFYERKSVPNVDSFATNKKKWWWWWWW